MDATLGQTLWQLVTVLATLSLQVLSLASQWLLVLVALAWCLWGIRWQRAWAALRHGGWAPLVLLIVLVAMVWSQLAPGEWTELGYPIANFWWQLGCVTLFTAAVFFCGYLQDYFGWGPAEIDLTPPAPSHGHEGHH